jgi:hypothetical protein
MGHTCRRSPPAGGDARPPAGLGLLPPTRRPGALSRPFRTPGRPAGGARVVIAGHAFVQNIRRGHYELAVDGPITLRVKTAFDQPALAV